MRIPLALLFLANALAGLLGSASSSPAQPPAKPRLQILVPAYFYPAKDKTIDGAKEWDKLFVASDRAPVIAIVNPGNGPGEGVDANYAMLFTKAKKYKKITLIGYVHVRTPRTEDNSLPPLRPLADVKADVNRWLKLYPGIQGIFVDEQPTGAADVGYQTQLYKYIRSKPSLKLVISNPGTICDEKYLSTPATVAACLFENRKPIATAEFPAWVAKYSPGRVAALSYANATPAAMREGLEKAVEKKIGLIYVTDASTGNVWGRLPSYWAEEVELVRKINLRP